MVGLFADTGFRARAGECAKGVEEFHNLHFGLRGKCRCSKCDRTKTLRPLDLERGRKGGFEPLEPLIGGQSGH